MENWAYYNEVKIHSVLSCFVEVVVFFLILFLFRFLFVYLFILGLSVFNNSLSDTH